ncbi:hypothetical protein Bca52824_030707 [Brassica carinata]|uniref:Knottins-like domain-containing protein n=1 Tax=Brassica carinata TaxID=52824 RepID=A0A8X7V5W4_BRACI|nr:hypothetical protein Bca52824_030707 [Brassica carinata]
MKLSMLLISAVLLMFMIFVASGMDPVTVEARTCESKSHKFRGLCVSTHNCANVCHTKVKRSKECVSTDRTVPLLVPKKVPQAVVAVVSVAPAPNPAS